MQIFRSAAGPVITTQPVDATACEGSDATFQVEVTGDPPMNFLWFSNSVLVTSGVVSTPTNSTVTFSNVQFYTSPQIPGTQFTGDLAYTEGGCTANYSVLAVFPAISCDDGSGKPDVSLCCGSGDYGAINPDFPIKCDAASRLCVLDAPSGLPAIGGNNLKKLCQTAQ